MLYFYINIKILNGKNSSYLKLCKTKTTYKNSIVNMGFENIAASVNKQSILDTINQIK